MVYYASPEMIRIIKNCVLFTGLLVCVLILKGNEGPFILRGHSFWPVFDSSGNLVVIYKDQMNQVNLATTGVEANKFKSQNLSLNFQTGTPVLKKDRAGEIAVLWEQSSSEKSEIYFGLMGENRIVSSKKVVEGSGFFFSGSLDFDDENNPWITFVQSVKDKFFIWVKNLNSQKSWIINSPFFSWAASPKLVIGRNNSVWVFWVGQDKGRDEIIYSHFTGHGWSSPGRLNRKDSFPHIFPDASCDQSGFPWVVWSAYDGHDYEIFCSSWDGKNWSKEEKITENQDTDSYPTIAFLLKAVPLIVWSRSDGRKSALHCRYKFDNQWGLEIELFSSQAGVCRSPKMAVEGDRIALLWQFGDLVNRELFSFYQLIGKSHFNTANQTKYPIDGPFLDENKYIGFGDSITYGGMDYEEHPEKGYIPRLEALLINYFGYTRVINEGLGGEITIEGLARISPVISLHLAKYLLLMEGTNDVIFLEISMDSAAFNLEEMIKKCLNFGVFPLLATIIPRKDWRWFLPLYRNRIFNLNERIHLLATNLKIPLVDQFKSFYEYPEEDGGWESLLSSDEIHPNEKGYQLMAETWFREIKFLPFPPVNVNVRRAHDNILFYSRECNILEWQSNNKIKDFASIIAYRIYRKISSEENSKFELLVTFPNFFRRTEQKYFDKNIVSSYNYAYVVSTLRKDGIEGPCSEVVYD